MLLSSKLANISSNDFVLPHADEANEVCHEIVTDDFGYNIDVTEIFGFLGILLINFPFLIGT